MILSTFNLFILRAGHDREGHQKGKEKKKRKHSHSKESRGPVQLSRVCKLSQHVNATFNYSIITLPRQHQYMKNRSERSAVTGQVMKKKVKKSSKDKEVYVIILYIKVFSS